MKTKTYEQFKKWVVDTCHTNVSKSSDYKYNIYEGDTAHAIYTAWYMFKRNFTEKEVDEYIQKDIEKSRKHFYSQGFSVTLYSKYWSDEWKKLVNIQIPLHNNNYYSGASGGWYFEHGYLQKEWTNIVKAIWGYWQYKWLEELSLNIGKEVHDESK